MRAVRMIEFGGPEVLVVTEVPDPEPGPGQVLIEVAAAAVVFVDTQVRAGGGPRRPELPVIPGNGVAGVITRVGEGVGSELIGAQVVSATGGSGGYAERAVTDAAGVIPVPPGLSLRDAAALLADGRTALGLVRAAEPAAGEWVLVEAAGGGVGSLLVQLCVAAGARVIAAAGGPQKLALAGTFGAEVLVDTRPDWAASVPAPVDLVFDGVGGEVGRAALSLVAPGGRFCVHGAASGSMTGTSGFPGEAITLGALPRDPDSLRELAASALAEAAAGRLRPTIGQTFPLAEAAAAHTAIEARATIGKTLLIP